MKHIASIFGIYSSQCVIPQCAPWAMHGIIVVDKRIISMGNSVKVYEVSREHCELIYVDVNHWDARKYVHDIMQNHMESLNGMLV